MRTISFLRSLVTSFALVLAVATSASAGDRTVTQTTPGEPMEVLFKALRAAEAGDFDTYLALLTPDMKWTATAIEGIRKYSWKRFSGRVKDYFIPGTDRHIIVTREEIDEKEGTARIFLAAPGNKRRDIPTPCRFKKIEGKWHVHENSL